MLTFNSDKQRAEAFFSANSRRAERLDGVLWFSKRCADSRRAVMLLDSVVEAAGDAITATERLALNDALHIVTRLAAAQRIAAQTARRQFDETTATPKLP